MTMYMFCLAKVLHKTTPRTKQNINVYKISIILAEIRKTRKIV